MAYTVREIEEIIANSDLEENKKAGYARDSKNPDVWKRAGIQPRQAGAGQTNPASSSGANKNTAKASSTNSTQAGSASANVNTARNTSSTKIPQLEEFTPFPGLNHIKGYADVDTMLSDGYKMSKAEREYAKGLTDEYFDEWEEKVRNGEYTTEQLVAFSSGQDEEYNKMQRLQNKADDIASFMLGMMDVADPLVTGLGNLLNSEEYDRQLGTFREMSEDARTQSPIAYGSGDIAMNMATYSAAQGALSQIPALNNAAKAVSGKIAGALGGGERATRFAKSAVNVLGDTGLDLALDIIPSAVTDHAEGLSGEQVLNNALLNTGASLGGNILGEAAIPVLGRVVSRLRGRGRQAAQAVDDLADSAAQAAKTGADTAESASRAAAEAIPETAARQTDDFVDMANVRDMDALDFAEAPSKITSMPKTTVPSGSRFRTLDNEVSKLVRMYGDDSLLNDLEDFRTNIVEFENTGSVQAADNASRALGRLDSALQGRTYTDGGSRTKSGAQKRAGTTYTYGREYAGINDLVEDAQQQFDDVFESTGSLSDSVPDDDISEAVSENVKAEESTNTTGYSPEESQYDMQNESFPDVPSTQNVSPTGTKTSKTRTNTMPGTGIMTEEELATRAPEAIFQYVPVNEQETLSQATEMIQRDGAENTLNNLLKKEALTAVDTDALMSLWRSTVQQAQQLDASGVDSTALWERANQIFKKVQEQSTRNGQALQALKKLQAQ